MPAQLLGSALRSHKTPVPDLLTSELLDEDTFYPALTKDLERCGSELIIEGPFK